MVDWISEIVSGTIWQEVANLCESAIEYLLKFLTQVIIQPTNPEQYIINFGKYLKGVQFFAGGLLVIFVVLAVFRQISGVMYTSEKSVGTYFIHVTFAGALIFMLPITVTKIFLPINNALIGFITSVGGSTSEIEDSLLSVWEGVREVYILVIIFIVFIIAFWLLAITAAIRYIETLLAIIISPLVALSVINNSDGLQVWIREVIAIVFTQTIHFLLLNMVCSIMTGVKNVPIMLLLSIGTIVVGLKGPQVLRQYLYRTGTSSATVAAAGSVGRIGMMAMVFRR